MQKLVNDSCSSNANYHAKQTFCEADIFAFKKFGRHGIGSVLFKLHHRIYIYIYNRIYEEKFGSS